VAFRGDDRTGRWCRAPVAPRKLGERKTGTLSARLRLGELQKPGFGTEEWNWLRAG